MRDEIIQVPRAQALFHLDRDPGETTDLSEREPKILSRLLRLAAEGRSLAKAPAC